MAQGRVPGLNGASSPRTVYAVRRDQVALFGGLLALAVVAWLATGDRMGSMESMPGMALGGLGFFVTVWVVMMAAMMLPSVAPTVLTYERHRGQSLARGNGGPVDASVLFLAATWWWGPRRASSPSLSSSSSVLSPRCFWPESTCRGPSCARCNRGRTLDRPG